MSPQSENQEAIRMYAMCVEQADRISARRGQANQFYLSLETLILGVPAFFGFSGAATDPLRVTVLAVVGIIVSAAWWLQLRSYRDLNSAKFKVINEIERTYFEVRPFSDEWVHLKTDQIKGWRPRYAELGSVERFVPAAFVVANLLVGVTAWL